MNEISGTRLKISANQYFTTLPHEASLSGCVAEMK
jgi:hypothetical protein